jgi:two-component system, NarL family, invasion response regulator UvrY
VTRQLLALLPGIRVVCASMHNQVAYARQVIRTGAFGYVTKNSAMHELYTAMEEAAAGQVYICEEIKNLISSQLLDGGLESIPQLSERELQIIDLLKEGHTSKEISKQLFISQKTVEVHRHNILRKLNLHNVAALVDYVNRHPNLCYS